MGQQLFLLLRRRPSTPGSRIERSQSKPLILDSVSRLFFSRHSDLVDSGDVLPEWGVRTFMLLRGSIPLG